MTLNYLQISTVLDKIPISPDSQCSYFPTLRSRSRAFRISDDISPTLFETAMNKGYRRCGDVYYQFNCKNCVMCKAMRVDIANFKPSKSQKRVWRRNQDIHFAVTAPNPNAVKEDIYLRYQYEQHFRRNPDDHRKEREFDSDSHLKTMYFQMYTNPQLSHEIEFYCEEKLIGFGIVDRGSESVSAVYFVFDPDYRQRSLGTLAILHGIAWAAENGFKYYHLGFYISEHPKMDYKKNFRKSQVLNRVTESWEDLCLPEL